MDVARPELDSFVVSLPYRGTPQKRAPSPCADKLESSSLLLQELFSVVTLFQLNPVVHRGEPHLGREVETFDKVQKNV